MATMMAATTCGMTSQTEYKHATWTSVARAPAGLCHCSSSWAARAAGRQSLDRNAASLCHGRAVSRQSIRRRQLRVSALFKDPDPDQKDSPLEGELAGIIFKVATVLVISLGVAALLFLARPVIDNTVASFPTRSASPPDSPSESFIPGLEPE